MSTFLVDCGCSDPKVGHYLSEGCYCSDKHHSQKQTGEGRIYHGLHSYMTVHHWRKPKQEHKQDRNLEVGAHAEAMEGCCVGACSHVFSDSFPIDSKSIAPPSYTTHNGQESLPSITEFKKCPSGLLTARNYGNIFSVPCSQMTSVSVNWHRALQHRHHLLLLFSFYHQLPWLTN